MAEMEQEPVRGRKETSGQNKEQSNTTGGRRRVIPGVNFEEMNFEQRRAPYKSGSRNRSEKEYDENRDEKRPNRKPNDR